MNYDWNDTPVIAKYYIFYIRKAKLNGKREELHLTIILHCSVTIRKVTLKNQRSVKKKTLWCGVSA